MNLRDLIPSKMNVTEIRKRRDLSPIFHKTKEKMTSMSKDQLLNLIKMLEGVKGESQ
jgi:hypothetical protein